MTQTTSENQPAASGGVRIQWAGETLDLLPERAVWWASRGVLLIADPHFGKDATFRHAGIPVPGAATASDAARLADLVHRHAPRRLIVLGDFMHDRRSRSPATLEELARLRRCCADLPITLVRGNHDRHAGDPPPELRFGCVDEPLMEGPMTLRHHPSDAAASFEIAGHVHPRISLRHGAGPALRAACFVFGPRAALLPAFGSFTGAHRITPRAGDRIFAVAEGQVVEIATRTILR